MFLTTPDAFLRTVSFGPGPNTVVALSGWSASWEAWQPTFELLSSDVRCISYDTRGCGASSCDPSTVTLSRLVDDVFTVLDAHQIDRCTLAGESLGGFVAMHAVLRDPSRFDSLVAVSAPPAVPPDHPRVAMTRHDYPATVRSFVVECFDGEANDRAARLHSWGESLFLGADREVAARLMEVCAGEPPQLSSITVPTTVVHGSNDAVVPIDAGRFIASMIPSARFVELTGASHAPSVTRAAELSAILRDVVAVA